MKKAAIFLITILISQGIAQSTYAQGFKPLTPAYSPEEMMSQATQGGAPPFKIITPILNAAGAQTGDPIIAKVDAALGQLVVHWPQDSVNLSQIHNILAQNPNMNNLKLLFPNQSEWMITQSEFADLYSKFNAQAGGLGFGVGGGAMPDLALSSLVDPAGSTASLAVLPIAAIKEGFKGVGETLEPVLREMRYQQLAFSEYMPDWLKVVVLEAWNFIMACYYSLVNFIWSLF